jgi:hypothetical protein
MARRAVASAQCASGQHQITLETLLPQSAKLAPPILCDVAAIETLATETTAAAPTAAETTAAQDDAER